MLKWELKPAWKSIGAPTALEPNPPITFNNNKEHELRGGQDGQQKGVHIVFPRLVERRHDGGEKVLEKAIVESATN